MLILDYQLRVNQAQSRAIDEAIRTVQFIRNKCLHLWMEVRYSPKFTTQDCSGCGYRVQKSLSMRTHLCPQCGLILDRDWNAALNMLLAGLAWLATHPASAGQSRTAGQAGTGSGSPEQNAKVQAASTRVFARAGRCAGWMNEESPCMYAGECQSNERLRVLKAGEKPPELPGTAAEKPGRESGWLDLERIKVSIRPGTEWRQMFGAAWRLQRGATRRSLLIQGGALGVLCFCLAARWHMVCTWCWRADHLYSRGQKPGARSSGGQGLSSRAGSATKEKACCVILLPRFASEQARHGARCAAGYRSTHSRLHGCLPGGAILRLAMCLP